MQADAVAQRPMTVLRRITLPLVVQPRHDDAAAAVRHQAVLDDAVVADRAMAV